MTPATEVTIPILDDADDEPEEVFTLELWDPVNAVLLTPVVTVTILDDDLPVTALLRRLRVRRHLGLVGHRAVGPNLRPPKQSKVKSLKSGVVGEPPGAGQGQRSRGEWVREWVRLRPRPAP